MGQLLVRSICGSRSNLLLELVLEELLLLLLLLLLTIHRRGLVVTLVGHLLPLTHRNELLKERRKS